MRFSSGNYYAMGRWYGPAYDDPGDAVTEEELRLLDASRARESREDRAAREAAQERAQRACAERAVRERNARLGL